MPILNSPFRPAWWLPGPHLQTLWGSLLRPRPKLDGKMERLELADGDFLDLYWSGPAAAPLILMLHGLEGSLASHYAAGSLHTLNRAGWRTCFMHFRGCSGEPNRLPRSYHSGETGDLQAVIDHLREQHGRTPACCIGVSLGGNVLLKWLGEQGPQARTGSAIAVSVPLQLAASADRLQYGLSRLYQRHLLQGLRRKYRRKFGTDRAPDGRPLDSLDNFCRFDAAVTAPLHGFASAEDYYARCSSRQFLKHIETPTLLIQARDDPFLWPTALPTRAELSPAVTLELAEHGGHVGFIEGRLPGRARYWLDRRIMEWLGGAVGTEAGSG
jgi:predicted alpha/beta-fold hydrolase